jgi:hypothetical protein
VLYLGLNGGGYDTVMSSQVGLVLWWIVLVGAAWGVLPSSRLSRPGWSGLALFGGFTAWTALASTWSISSERSLQDLSLVASYLGVLLLAVAIHRDRGRAVRHTVNAIGVAVAIVATLAVASRLDPNAFPAAHVTATFLGSGAQGRLSWPLNYWNGLAALLALGLPLLLSIATPARTLLGQAVAAAAIPLLAVCGHLTFSRGGAVAAAVALLAFLALAPNRLPKLATMLVTGAGSAILIAGVAHRSAIVHGLTDHVAAVQGRQLLVAIALVCTAAALGQAGIGLAMRHGTLPRILRVSRGRARMLLAAGIVVALVAALAAGAPSRLSHAWSDFKRGSSVGQSDLTARFSTLSGNGRYEYWKIAVQSTHGHVLQGAGPGTFQLLWEPRAPFYSYVVNAHSLYVETFAEVGAAVRLALLVGFLLLLLGAAVRAVMRSEHEARARAAGGAAAFACVLGLGELRLGLARQCCPPHSCCSPLPCSRRCHALCGFAAALWRPPAARRGRRDPSPGLATCGARRNVGRVPGCDRHSACDGERGASEPGGGRRRQHFCGTRGRALGSPARARGRLGAAAGRAGARVAAQFPGCVGGRSRGDAR